MGVVENGTSFHTDWEKIHAGREWGGYPSEHVIRFVARNFYSAPDRSKVKILDFGCGAGANTWYLANEGFDTYAFDGSKSAVARAEKNLAKKGLAAHFLVADGIQLPYESETFDAIIDNVMIYSNTLANIRMMYGECHRFLKTGGKFFSCVFGREMTGYGSGTEIEPNTFADTTEGRAAHTGYMHCFDRQELHDVLAEAGFSRIVIEEVRYTDVGSLVHQYIAKAEK
ncbi:MAG: class I SAM-dependent methyltransferase [Selenomonas sp.]|uniref:class I SAM-dependent methyltransferase n=1 Tax=Selenomonas sp. TaxID=2053611 RepID=UPI0025D84196|nr:class I SAM-dependent methyltransferase [Selenomonas sp.]MCI6086944.1 class I SAM-dependent methyltransferase [Selenomonas sp.]MDY4415587.1 class I SAM-dependent methyltransferase [Selenomonas sp.]